MGLNEKANCGLVSFMTVPRIWDLMRFKIERELDAQAQSAVFKYTPELLKRIFLRRIIRKKLGFEMTRYFASGAAKLNLETAEKFRSWGIQIHEGYGLTETLCISTINPPGYCRLGTVGKIYPGVSLRIASDGEVCLKAPFHFLGYYQQPELTSQVLRDGWFHTGDIGVMDEKGCLRITDRKKDLFKTTNGKYVAPLAIEIKLKGRAGIREAMVIGDGRPHCVALVSMDLAIMNEADLLRWVDEINKSLPPHEQVRTVGYVTESWTVDSGEMTPSLKLKRRIILDRYEKQIEELFENRSRVRFVGSTSLKTENELSAHLSV
jgi:long-chain acyl-CoA synthetase